MSNFDPNAIIRGAQLTLVGGIAHLHQTVAEHQLNHMLAHRALQNPALFTSDHYRQVGLAVLAGLAIRLIIAIPVSSGLPCDGGNRQH
jgi:hypothetical protein